MNHETDKIKDSEGERQNKKNYYLNNLGRPDIIAIQTEIELTEEEDRNPSILTNML
ncbi:5225_t:CDS:2, partial [Gigaspora margarita]